MKRLLPLFALALGLFALSAAPDAVAAPRTQKHPPKIKKPVPKPKAHKPAKVKPKSPHRAGAARGHAKIPKRGVSLKSRKPVAKPRVPAKPVIKPKPPSRLKPKPGSPIDRDRRMSDRVRDRISEREFAWSRFGIHERAWSHSHWMTHRFARLSGTGEAAAYHFDSHWWHNHVSNPGTVSWNSESLAVIGAATVGAAPKAASPNIVMVPPPVVKLGKPLPMAPSGDMLAKVLDSMRVESRWLPEQKVDWKSGVPAEPRSSGPASNGGAFVAAVCDRLGARIPSDGYQDFLPGSQFAWFMESGGGKGWAKVGEVEAQVLANQGWLVVAAWRNIAPAGERTVAGQLAVVRPDLNPASEISLRGPRIAMAGLRNHNDIAIKDGFPPGAWRGQEVVYLAHRATYK